MDFGVPMAVTIVFFGTIVALVVNLIVGTPVVLASQRIFRQIVSLQVLIPVVAGAALGAYLCNELTSPALPMDLKTFLEGAIFGSAAALSMVLICRRLDRSWDAARSTDAERV
jgi:hypothetical protein